MRKKIKKKYWYMVVEWEEGIDIEYFGYDFFEVLEIVENREFEKNEIVRIGKVDSVVEMESIENVVFDFGYGMKDWFLDSVIKKEVGGMLRE